MFFFFLIDTVRMLLLFFLESHSFWIIENILEYREVITIAIKYENWYVTQSIEWVAVFLVWFVANRFFLQFQFTPQLLILRRVRHGNIDSGPPRFGDRTVHLYSSNFHIFFFFL